MSSSDTGSLAEIEQRDGSDVCLLRVGGVLDRHRPSNIAFEDGVR